jgi:hypothetical protein
VAFASTRLARQIEMYCQSRENFNASGEGKLLSGKDFLLRRMHQQVTKKNAKNQIFRPQQANGSEKLKPGGYDASTGAAGAFYPKSMISTTR